MSDENKTVVLVADDEPSTLALVTGHLRAKGYRVIEATDGDQAWELAHEHLPHIVVLDVMMPGMSGWEVCRKIREAVSLAHTGVVMLTGIGENLNEMTSPLYGADAYVDKPFEFSDLDAKIKETLSSRNRGALGRPDKADVAEQTDDDWDVTNEEAPKPALAKSSEHRKPATQTLTQRITKAARKVAQALNPLARDAGLDSDSEGEDVEPKRPRKRPRKGPQKSGKSAAIALPDTPEATISEPFAKPKVERRAQQSAKTESAKETKAPAPKQKSSRARSSGKRTPARSKAAPSKRGRSAANKARVTKAKRSAKAARSTRSARSAKRRPEAPPVKRLAKQAAIRKGGAKRKAKRAAPPASETRIKSGRRLSKTKKSRAVAKKAVAKKAVAKKAPAKKAPAKKVPAKKRASKKR